MQAPRKKPQRLRVALAGLSLAVYTAIRDPKCKPTGQHCYMSTGPSIHDRSTAAVIVLLNHEEDQESTRKYSSAGNRIQEALDISVSL